MRVVRHTPALTVFAAVTMAWLWPLWGAFGSAVPGAGAGDNLTFVWNTWWMRTVLAGGLSPLWCPVLFVPWGVDLTLNTHTALPSLIAAAFSRTGSIVAATNLMVVLHLLLNFTTTYALALRLTQNTPAAALAGVVFGSSPYVGAHLPGHFNLIAAWVLPLTALLVIQSLDTRRSGRTIALGLVVGAAAYIDYYYFLYAVILATVVVVHRSVTVHRTPGRLSRWQLAVLSVIAIVLLLDLAVLGTILMTGGTAVRIAGASVSMRGIDNPVAAAGLLLLLSLGVAWVPPLRARFAWDTLRADLRRLAPAALTVVLALLPLLLAAVQLWTRGDYVTQKYLWRSAPAGIDVGTLFLGNPTGLLWGSFPSGVYAQLGIDAVEHVAWVGPGVAGLCLAAIMLRRREPDVTRWLLVAAIFVVWGLGPYLVLFGRNLPLLLPATLVRYVPVVANARIPARAMIVVYLAAAMLAAAGFTALVTRRRGVLAAVLGALVVADYFPRTPPLYRPDHPPVYDLLRDQAGAGAVVELPLGLRDGFGETGRFDARTLWYQTIHGRPMTGGFVARLPPRITADYKAAPVLGQLLRLSSGGLIRDEIVPSPADAGAARRDQTIRFVVVNRPASPPDLVEFVRRALPLRLLASDAERDAYVLEERR